MQRVRKKGPNGCFGYILGMKTYPVMWGLFHKPIVMRIPTKQPGFNGKYGQVFVRGSGRLYL